MGKEKIVRRRGKPHRQSVRGRLSKERGGVGPGRELVKQPVREESIRN